MKRAKKTYAVVLAAGIAAAMVSCLQADQIPLECSVLRWIDGKDIGINGDGIKGMIYIRRETRKMQHGAKNSQGVLEGSYEFRGKHCTIHELARVEAVIDQEFSDKKMALNRRYLQHESFEIDWTACQRELEKEEAREMRREEEKITASHRVRSDNAEDQEMLAIELNRARRNVRSAFLQKSEEICAELIRRHLIPEKLTDYLKELTLLQAEREGAIAGLAPCLRQAKDDFKRINEPYLASINGTKSMMLVLIEESCQRRGRDMNPPSFLLTWGKVAEGKEMESFEENINSFRELDLFCTDLTNFLEDVIYSCPKACAQAGLQPQKRRDQE